jgi:acetylglutamate kinase
VKILIKLGGTLLDSAESRKRLAAEIAREVEQGLDAVVVHGGGKQMTAFLAERGVESKFINGLRVTTPEVLDAVLKVLTGTVNKELVASLVAAGACPIGLNGVDGLITEAHRISDELGAVGKPIRSDTKVIRLLRQNGYLPVIACLAGDRQGNLYNVNADQMACSIASAIPSEKLLFLTDVDGVKGADGKIYSVITPSLSSMLIEKGVATGGMRAKLEAACQALEQGVKEIVIAPGAQPEVLKRLVRGAQVGTRLVQD